ncbi:Fur family transcriptional regulator [Planctopirus hydrillae]|uniref:Fur family transcriptional regulator n=1 Tax=Planctopirus hydrillae TaxID=1841610 RepID=A0A1C3E593_9PLAN|nr:transcriptional repressor [Planctopirus hydrillae]ODA28421.1 Fur family transcriptional regulator [Planctopirus hydrillae]
MSKEAETDAGSVAEIRRVLGKANLRTTAARIAVLRQLQQATAPVTHAEVAEELVPTGFDKATVFRNLTDLVDAGLVTRSELGDHVWRFELNDLNNPEKDQHPHFVCITCGKVTCLHGSELPKFDKESWARIGKVNEILLKGFCVQCANSTKS